MRSQILIPLTLLITLLAVRIGHAESTYLSFTPTAAKDFDFQFAYQDAANFYRLEYNARQERLVLSRTLNGMTQQLDSVDDAAGCNHVAVHLLPHEMRVELDGRACMISHDTSFRSGGNALDGRPDAAIAVELQPIAIDENFDDPAAVAERWSTVSGRWKIIAPRDELVELRGGQPRYSLYCAQDTGFNFAAAGESYWSDIRIRAFVKPQPGSRAGIAFNIFDSRNYSSLLIAAPAEGQRGGYAELVYFRDGVAAESLQLDCDSFTPGSWHELIVATDAEQPWCEIDGQVFFTGFWQTDSTSAGGIGLVSDGGAEFEDVSARSFDSHIETFDTNRMNLWKYDGEWQRGEGLRGSGIARFTRSPTGTRRIDAEIKVKTAASAAILANLSSAGDSCYAFGLFDRQWQFRRVLNNQPRILARVDATGGAGSTRLTLIDRAGIFQCMVDGGVVFTVADAALPENYTGLLGVDASFTRFRVAEEPLHHGAVIFAGDFSDARGTDAIRERKGFILGEIFKPAGLGWHYDGNALRTQSADSLVFTEPLPKDVSIEARVAVRGEPFVFLSADAAGKRGYRLGITPDARMLLLFRNERTIAERPLIGTAETVTLELLRQGTAVLARVDGKPVLMYNDPNPLLAGYAGITGAAGAEFHTLTVRSERAASYRFDTSAHTWRIDGGEWTVRAGVPDGLSQHWITGDGRRERAALWEKVLRGGGFSFHVTVSPHTLGFADGRSRTHKFQNVEIIIGGAPGHAGVYSFFIRPDGEEMVRLLRAGQVVAEETYPVQGGEPVRVSVIKTGAKIDFRLNNEHVLLYDGARLAERGFIGLAVQDSYARFSNVLVISE